MLVRFQGADGMKTGFICDSGFNIVASATRDGRKLVAVVLGDHPRLAPRPRLQPPGERLQALLLEIAVRNQHRRARDPGILEQLSNASCTTTSAASARPKRRRAPVKTSARHPRRCMQCRSGKLTLRSSFPPNTRIRPPASALLVSLSFFPLLAPARAAEPPDNVLEAVADAERHAGTSTASPIATPCSACWT